MSPAIGGNTIKASTCYTWVGYRQRFHHPGLQLHQQIATELRDNRRYTTGHREKRIKTNEMLGGKKRAALPGNGVTFDDATVAADVLNTLENFNNNLDGLGGVNGLDDQRIAIILLGITPLPHAKFKLLVFDLRQA